MSSLLTLGDYLAALAGNAHSAGSVEPTIEELNAEDVAPFIAPSDSAIAALKQLLPYEGWLYLMGADSLEIVYNHRLGEQEARQHFVRSLALLDLSDKNIPLTAPAVQARVHWLQRRVLNLDEDTTSKPYYQLMAEGQVKRAKMQAGLTALWETAGPEEQQQRLRKHWGDLPPQVLEEREQLAARQQKEQERLVVSPRRQWDLGIDHPAFGPWLVEEVLRREPLEVDAYLTVMWRIGTTTGPVPHGDSRQLITPEQVPYVQRILASAVEDSQGKAQRILKLSQEWFMSQINPFLTTGNSAKELLITSATVAPTTPKLTLRQVALLYAYTPGAVITTKTAAAIAKEYGHTSGPKLYNHYRTVSLKQNRTGISDGQIPSMVKDITAIKSMLPEQEKKIADNELQVMLDKK